MGIENASKTEQFKHLFYPNSQIHKNFELDNLSDLNIDETNKPWQNWLYSDLGLKFGGIHYLSKTEGIWFRVVFGKYWFTNMENELNKNNFKFDVARHEETYDLLTRNQNIFVDNNLKSNFSISINHPDGVTNEDFIRINENVIALIGNNLYHEFHAWQ